MINYNDFLCFIIINLLFLIIDIFEFIFKEIPIAILGALVFILINIENHWNAYKNSG